MFSPPHFHNLIRPQLKAARHGFTLVEAILSLMILGGVAATAVALYTTGLGSIRGQVTRLQLDSAARSRMEQLLATNFTALSGGSENKVISDKTYTVTWTVTTIDIDGDGKLDTAARRIDVKTDNATLSTIVTDNQGCLGEAGMSLRLATLAQFSGSSGMTLVELTISITILAIITAASAFLLSTCLQTDAQAMAQAGLQSEGAMLMDRLSAQMRNTPYMLIPNNASTTRTLMATCGYINDDNDYYFGDTRFPRVDEDTSDDMTKDGLSGINHYDIDGDGRSNGGLAADDDEDLKVDEDPLDGIDNDGDGNIDEDCGKDMNADGASGIKGMDDNGDGIVDNGLNAEDDDEDGRSNEDPIQPLMVVWDGSTTLNQTQLPSGSAVALSTDMVAFSASYQKPTTTRGPQVVIKFQLTNNSETASFIEYVYPRNMLERSGKKVL